MRSAVDQTDREEVALQAYIDRYRSIFRVRLLTVAGLALAVAISFSVLTALVYLLTGYAAFGLYIWAVERAARRLDQPGVTEWLKRWSIAMDFVVSAPSVGLALYVNTAAPQLHIECQLLVITLVMLAGLQVHLTNAGVFAAIAAPLVGLLLISLPDLPPDRLVAHLLGGALFTAALVAASWRQSRSDQQSAREAVELAIRNAELERALADSHQQRGHAQAASRAKSEFLANISHEIRTPLNGILGMAQVMEASHLTPAQRAQLAVVQASGHDLLEVVNAVLDISKIEAGKIEITPTVFDLDRFAAGLEQLYRPLALDKGVAFSVALDPKVRGWRYGDEVRLRQVLSNLASNAVKFTDAGGIKVEIGGDDEGLIATVSDTGCGIPPEGRDRIFERFAQVDGSSTRRVGGTGLGLAICREILALLGGAIRLEESGAAGSRFAIRVPYPRAARAPEGVTRPTVAQTAAAHGPHVLIVDDDPANRAVLQAMLTPLGGTLATAADGVEAVAAWEGGHWDAVLMDIHMPRMDGLEACRAIRTREAAAGRPRTPIIAVTASVLKHETQPYLEAGMDEIIAKPVEMQRLLAVLKVCTASGPGRAAEVGRSSRAPSTAAVAS